MGNEGGHLCARTPSKHCRGTVEQDTAPPNAEIGPCDELVNSPEMYSVFARVKRGYAPTYSCDLAREIVANNSIFCESI